MRNAFFGSLMVAVVLAWGCGRDDERVANRAPTVEFAVTCSALACTFTDQSTDPDGSVASRRWDFGDGGTSTSVNPSHDYAVSTMTEFTVKLTVTDDLGEQAVRSKTFTVSPPARLQCHDAVSPGELVDCTLPLPQAARVEIELTSRECVARGTTLVVTQPVEMTLFTDGCYEPPVGTVFTLSDNGNPFPLGVQIGLQMLPGAGDQVIPPSLIVISDAAPWVLQFDDGVIQPADEDVTITIRLVP